MPRDGSGNYTRNNGIHSGPNLWAQDASANIKITTLNHDTHDEDIANALSASIANDGQTPITANLQMSGYKHTNVGAASTPTDYARVDQVQNGTFLFGGVSTGAPNNYIISVSPALTAYISGQRFVFFAHQANTGVAVVNINGLGLKAIRKEDGFTGLVAGDIILSAVVDIIYDTSIAPGVFRYIGIR